MSVDALTEKDLKDLEFGLNHMVDCVAFSLLEPRDVSNLRKYDS
ncbi:MAG: hypothetical protein IPM57_03010 [Oligoflexia bacterium]|nr:hypothetical protein [Oligoflexia bacterium]